ncbi:hypothetical protein SCG7086_CI_00070 [Chlamydiales bacterium SCGC AG-110-P3]|nr:hypothetical protein SCG7086_CI_00070 [Chlamydiales bacterium SCGC AG-110-P3]
MCADQISNISGSPYSPNRPGAIGKKGKEIGSPKKEASQLLPKGDKFLPSGKKPETGEVKGPVLPAGTSQEDMARYVKLAMNGPAEIREDKVAAARLSVDKGEYGEEALNAILDGLEKDLLPPL